jgi:glycosyltransferase involved in cell wall biosynthesis
MITLYNPKWLAQFNYPYREYAEIPAAVFDSINRDLDRVQSKAPLVSILIAAWNEEVNILRCIASLAKMNTAIPFEIIVINNNSTDKTQDTLNRLRVKSLFEKNQGCGPARQLGQEHASGDYILLADADCHYPSCWVNEMIKVLKKPGVVCVYGRYSFISEPGYPRWKLSLLESLKDVVAEFRQIKRPHLNAYGLSMGYLKKYGLKVGFTKTSFRGNDGVLGLLLMQYGKIKQVRSNKARAWTGPRTLQLDGSFSQAFSARLYKEFKSFANYFYSQDLKDTKPYVD